ncbi:LexA repressor 1 [Steroidobacter agaridevorans]|uniref:LexA repressor n=1 Tax=Steroidobacter agaridevorans TaxID=2695856 RepID=A0A829YMA5_9GAMM|nr:transcriptional repressor LexA [Steroidobacter agaridevorans]GFE83963.1 LexA repressor 1 [Steroidobacter agaridevorans]GFE91414.1 LexA repressor 1 [Steroidobacter agaridevorans]
MSDLTRKQLEVLAFIRRFMESDGLPPTRGEIADGLGLKNRQGIDQHLRALASKGAIELVPGISRGIRLREEFVAEPAGAARSSSSLPLLGRIAAGAPILATSHIEEHVTVDASLFQPHADFLLRVRGDSMKDADILDRDLLAVHQTSQVRSGQIVVARLVDEDEATVKYYRRQGHMVRLEPANAAYRPIEIDLREQELSIEGLAVGVIRTSLSRVR